MKQVYSMVETMTDTINEISRMAEDISNRTKNIEEKVNFFEDEFPLTREYILEIHKATELESIEESDEEATASVTEEDLPITIPEDLPIHSFDTDFMKLVYLKIHFEKEKEKYVNMQQDTEQRWFKESQTNITECCSKLVSHCDCIRIPRNREIFEKELASLKKMRETTKELFNHK